MSKKRDKERLQRAVQKGIKWLATEYHFLKELHEDLETLEEHEKDNQDGWQIF